MKSKCSFTLKALTALVLAVVMLFGTVATTIAATVDVADTGYYYSGGDYRLKSSLNSWSETSNYVSGVVNSANNQQHYFDIYLYGCNDDTESTTNWVYFRYIDKDSGNYADFGPTWYNCELSTSGMEAIDIQGYNDKGSFYIKRKTLGTSSTTLYRVRLWLEHDGSPWAWYAKTTVSALSPSITTKNGSTTTSDFVIGDTVSLSTSVTNDNKIGTVSYAYQYKLSTAADNTYQNISSTSWDTSSLAAGTYTIKVTATDNGMVVGKNAQVARTAETATTNITVSAPNSPAIDTFTIDDGASKTLNIGETATLASTTSHATGYTVYYTTASDKISIDGTTVKALAPVTNATITATLSNDGGTTAVDTATVTVTVNTPTIASYYYGSNSTKSLLIGEATGNPTKSLTSGTYNSDSSITWKYYLASSGNTVENTYATINNTTGVLTAKSTYAAVTSSNQSAYAEATITYNGVSYTTERKARTYNVYAYFLYGFGSSGWAKSSSNMFAYDSTRSIWSVSKALTQKTYNASDDNGFKVVKNVNGNATYYQYNGTLTMTRSNNDNTNTTIGTSGSSNIGITADVAGTYVFDLTLNASNVPTNIMPHYPQKIIYDKNGKTTTEFPTTPAYVTYNTTIGSAPATTPDATGYRFTGWKKSGENTAFDFANTKITSATTINAQWEEVTAGIALTAYTDGSASTAGGTIQINGVDVTETSGVGIATSRTLVASVNTSDGYVFAGWDTDGTYAEHIKLYTNSGCTTAYTGTENPLPTTIYIKTDGYKENAMTTANSIVKANFVNGNRTIAVGALLAIDDTGYKSSNTFTTDPTLTGAGGAVLGNEVELTANEPSGYKFVGWYSAATAQTTAGISQAIIEDDTTLTFDLEATSDLYYYALYKKIYHISIYNTWVNKGTQENPRWFYLASPPHTVTLTRPGETTPYTTYTYVKSDTLSECGEDGTNSPVYATGNYHEGNLLQVLSGDTVTLSYTALASSDDISGIFFNNAIRYSLDGEPDNKYVDREPNTGTPDSEGNYDSGDDDWEYTYLPDTTLFADQGMYDTTEAPYSNIIGKTYEASIDQNTHTVTWVAKGDYLNIDMEIANKKRIYFSYEIDDAKKTEKTVYVKSKNQDNYYYIGETVGNGTSDFYVAAMKSSNQTNKIDGSNVTFYKATADGKKGEPLTAAQLTATGLAITAATSTSTSGANGTALYITGTMPAYDIYVDLGVVTTYAVKLDSKMLSDTIAGKTKFNQAATINANGGSSNLTQAYNSNTAGTAQGPSNVTAGSTITLSYSLNNSWKDYYMFVGWYKGDASGPDLENGKLSTKDTFSYKPTGNCTVYAVGTRDLFINGSKYLFADSNTDWNSHNNFRMSFDPSMGTKGVYYYTITDTVFRATNPSNPSSAAYTTTDNGDNNWSAADGYTHNTGDNRYYWLNDTDSTHGNAFFQILDTATGNSAAENKSVWGEVHSFKSTSDGVTFGKALPRGGSGDSDGTTRKNGQGFFTFSESGSPGWSTPITIYLDPDGWNLSVKATPIYPHIYLSNGYKNIDESNPNTHAVTYTINGAAASNSNRTENGSGWTGLGNESTVRDITIKARNATVEFTKEVASANYIVSNFLVYNLAQDTVKAYPATKIEGTNKYKASITTVDDQSMYVVPIIEFNAYTSTIEKMTVIVDSTQLNTDKWGDLVGCYAWYSSGDAYGAYPGQLMVPSADGLSWKANFPTVNPSNPSAKLVGITFSNYVDGSATWLGGDTVMNTVNNVGPIIPDYNNITGTDNGAGTYDAHNFKCQTYDYREPIAYYTNKDDAVDEMLLTFALKSGNADLITWRHGDLVAENIKTFQTAHPSWSDVNFEYLTDPTGDYYTDLNGVALADKPTPSFYIVAKGMNVYKDNALTMSFYTGKLYDNPTGITYSGYANATAGEVDMSYAVQWYVYDASGTYITTILSAGFADRDATHADKSLIAQKLIDMGYGVDYRSVAISYDVPRYCYSSTGVDPNKIPNTGDSFDAYRYTGQWYEQDRFATARVYAKIGMMTDNGEEVKDASSGYFGGTATVTVDTSVLNHIGAGQYGTGSDTTEDGTMDYAFTTVVDGDKGGIVLTASSQNFKGWYYYDSDDKLQLASEDAVYRPSYSKSATYIAIYEAKANYKYIYTGREGGTDGRSYSLTAGDLTEAEIGAGNKLNISNRTTEFNTMAPGASKISIWKKNIDFSSWSAIDNTEDYFLKKTCTGITTQKFNLTYYYRDAIGTLRNGTVSNVTYNTDGIDLTQVNGGITIPSMYRGHRFIGWFDYTGNTIGSLLSTQHNFGMVLAKNTTIIAVYEGDTYTLPTTGTWHVDIDDKGITREMTSASTGIYYYDAILRVHYGQGTNTSLPAGAEVGILVIDDNGSGLSTTAGDTNLKKFVNGLESGQTAAIGTGGRTVTKVSSGSVSSFGRVDLACRRDFAKVNGNHFSVYAYVKVGDTFAFTAVETGSTWTIA